MARTPRLPRGPRERPQPQPAQQFDPAAEYQRLTGRVAEQDWLAGVVLAAPRYLNEWARVSILGLLRELDRGLDESPTALVELTVQPVATWARTALVWWASLRQSGLVWKEVEKAASIPSTEDLDEVLGDPPLRRMCAIFGLARAIQLVGYAVVRGLPMGNLQTFLRDAVARAFVTSGAEVQDPDGIDLGSVATMIEAARASVAAARKGARQRSPKAGRHMDPVLHAFIRGVQWAREPDPVSGQELALLAAAAGMEPCDAEHLGEATKRWSMRLSRLGKMGPVSPPPPGAPPLKGP